MNMKLKQLVNSVSALQKLYNSELPVRAAFRVRKISQELQPLLTAYDQIRIPLVKKYSDEKGNFDPSKIKEFVEALEPVLEEEVTLSTYTLSLTDLEQANIKLSPAELEGLAWLIVE